MKRPIGSRPRRRVFRGRVAREGGEASLSEEWRAWVAENLLLGAVVEDLVGTLTMNGVPRALASREVERIRGSSLMNGAQRVARLVRRHEMVARMMRESNRVASEPGAVERRSGVSPREFFDRYYAAGVPLLVTDALAVWPAVSSWSPAQLKARYGHVQIEATAGRDADPLYEPHFRAHASSIGLGELCDRIASAGETNDFYLIANNRLTKHPALAAIFEDIAAPHEYLDERRNGDCVSLWLGPGGTVTPLHHDTSNVFFCQVFGRKRVLLFPPFELFLSHSAHHGVHSPIDAENPDLDLFPEFAGVTRKEVELAPGEGLFIPVGWWHHVRALEPSISMSFTNFRAPNHFAWYYPGSVE